jgi:hypothetical protein
MTSPSDFLNTVWAEITARPSGPFAFRFYFQPLMAAVLAVRDGVKDARHGRPPYLETLFKEKSQRRSLMREAWAAVGKVFILAIVLDLIYQVVVIRAVRPLEGLFIAILLAIVPYALLRGPVNRIARHAAGNKKVTTKRMPQSGSRSL